MNIRLVIYLLLIISSPSYSKQNSGWLAFGELRGYIQTCGCDPLTNLGGVKRIARAIMQERIFNNESIHVYDLGNNFSFSLDDHVKNKYIAKALVQIKPDAALFSAFELLQNTTIKNYPYVLTNFNTEKTDIKKSMKIGNTTVFGYVWHKKIAKLVSAWDKNLENKIRKATGHKTLLFYGPDDHLKRILDSKIFNEIISGNTSEWDAQSNFKEKEQPHTLVRAHTEVKVFMVPHAGLGILRGGSLAKSKTKSLEDLISTSNKKSKFTSNLIGSYPITWLTPNFEDNSPLSKLMENYSNAAANLYQEFIQKELSTINDRKYIGAHACKNCHSKEYKIWKESEHAKALETLKEKNKEKNMDCVSCHVVGLKDKGFISEKHTVHLKGVQCENCHGPRREHAMNPLKKLKTNPYKCESCHHSPHSPSFILEKYWSKIKH